MHRTDILRNATAVLVACLFAAGCSGRPAEPLELEVRRGSPHIEVRATGPAGARLHVRFAIAPDGEWRELPGEIRAGEWTALPHDLIASDHCPVAVQVRSDTAASAVRLLGEAASESALLREPFLESFGGLPVVFDPFDGGVATELALPGTCVTLRWDGRVAGDVAGVGRGWSHTACDLWFEGAPACLRLSEGGVVAFDFPESGGPAEAAVHEGPADGARVSAERLPCGDGRPACTRVVAAGRVITFEASSGCASRVSSYQEVVEGRPFGIRWAVRRETSAGGGTETVFCAPDVTSTRLRTVPGQAFVVTTDRGASFTGALSATGDLVRLAACRTAGGAEEIVHEFAYDDDGLLRSIRLAGRPPVEMDYDAGRRLSRICARGLTWTVAYASAPGSRTVRVEGQDGSRRELVFRDDGTCERITTNGRVDLLREFDSAGALVAETRGTSRELECSRRGATTRATVTRTTGPQCCGAATHGSEAIGSAHSCADRDGGHR